MSELIDVAFLSFRRPRQAAKWILALNLNLPQTVMFVGLTAVLVALVLSLMLRISPAPETAFPGSVEAMVLAMVSTPLRFAALQFGYLVYSGFGLYQIGRWAGGKGSLTQSLAIMAALQLLQLVMASVVTLSALIFPPAALLAMVAFPVILLWILTQFVMALHGFTSPLAVLFGIVAGYVGLIIVLSLVLSILGFGS